MYDPVRDRMLMTFMGNSGGWQTWERTEAPAWSSLTALPNPPGGISGKAVYDPVRDRIVLVISSYDPSQVWELRLGEPLQWEQIGTGASGLVAHALYDPGHDRLLLVRDEGWAWAFRLDTNSWENIAATPPPYHESFAAIYDPVRDRIVIHGGVDRSDWEYPRILDETWALWLSGTPAWYPLGGGPVAVEPGAKALTVGLDPAVPNPASRSCRIGFTFPRTLEARLTVADLAGRRVATLAQRSFGPGHHQVTWDGRMDGGAAPAGLYFVKLEAADEVRVGKVVLAP
jgi:hypothetical protein